MKTIVITSGGTTEYIDKVRKITNVGRGTLGTIIANTFLKNKNFHVIYICTKTALRPNVDIKNQDRLTIIEVETTLQLKEAIENTLKTHSVDYFIHSAAVSDYYVDFVTNSTLLEESLNEESLKNYIENPLKKLDNSSKLSSYEDDLIIVLKKTPKIISLIKKISPRTTLIGFKLLENVEVDNLINVGYKLLKSNDCEAVVANDLKDIGDGYHKAYIIDKDKSYIEVNTNEEIAKELLKIATKKEG